MVQHRQEVQRQVCLYGVFVCTYLHRVKLAQSEWPSVPFSGATLSKHCFREAELHLQSPRVLLRVALAPMCLMVE